MAYIQHRKTLVVLIACLTFLLRPCGGAESKRLAVVNQVDLLKAALESGIEYISVGSHLDLSSLVNENDPAAPLLTPSRATLAIQGNCTTALPDNFPVPIDALTPCQCVLLLPASGISLLDAGSAIWLTNLYLKASRTSSAARADEEGLLLVNLAMPESRVWLTHMGFEGDEGIVRGLMVSNNSRVYIADSTFAGLAAESGAAITIADSTLNSDAVLVSFCNTTDPGIVRLTGTIDTVRLQSNDFVENFSPGNAVFSRATRFAAIYSDDPVWVYTEPTKEYNQSLAINETALVQDLLLYQTDPWLELSVAAVGGENPFWTLPPNTTAPSPPSTVSRSTPLPPPPPSPPNSSILVFPGQPDEPTVIVVMILIMAALLLGGSLLGFVSFLQRHSQAAERRKECSCFLRNQSLVRKHLALDVAQDSYSSDGHVATITATSGALAASYQAVHQAATVQTHTSHFAHHTRTPSESSSLWRSPAAANSSHNFPVAPRYPPPFQSSQRSGSAPPDTLPVGPRINASAPTPFAVASSTPGAFTPSAHRPSVPPPSNGYMVHSMPPSSTSVRSKKSSSGSTTRVARPQSALQHNKE